MPQADAAPPVPVLADLPEVWRGLRVAVVHDFLCHVAGSERVLEQILRLVPQADVFALFDFLPPGQRDCVLGKPVQTTLIQRLPGARRYYRQLLPVIPFAVEQLDVTGYDAVISSSCLAAKGVLTRPDQLHVCYCHSPVRYAWDLQHQYLSRSGLGFGPRGLLARAVLHYVRQWDRQTAHGVDVFLCNSRFIAQRIRKAYRRDARVIHPPVNTDAFSLQTDKPGGYVTASRFVPYKRIDLVIEAFNRMPERSLTVVGTGPEEKKLRKLAGPSVTFTGYATPSELVRQLQNAKAFLFAAEEDFGILPVEAMATGTPVLALNRGGTAETVLDGETGLLFGEQSADAVVQAVQAFEAKGVTADAATIREHARGFGEAVFRQRMAEALEQAWANWPPSLA